MKLTYPSHIILPPDLEWYAALGGEATGWVCEIDGPGWWHVSELDLSEWNRDWPTLAERQPEAIIRVSR